jgi:hypothetical protein
LTLLQVAVSHCKKGKGIIKVNGRPLSLVEVYSRPPAPCLPPNAFCFECSVPPAIFPLNTACSPLPCALSSSSLSLFSVFRFQCPHATRMHNPPAHFCLPIQSFSAFFSRNAASLTTSRATTASARSTSASRHIPDDAPHTCTSPPIFFVVFARWISLSQTHRTPCVFFSHLF